MTAVNDSDLSKQRRQEILAASLKCFAQNGFHATSMVDIARASGMSAGNIYNYFQGKDEIVEELCARELKNISKHIATSEDNLDRNRNAHEELRKLALTRLNPLNAKIALEILLEGTRNNRIAQAVRQLDQHWRDMLLNVYMKGHSALTQEQARTRMESDLCMIEGLSFRILIQPEVDREALAAELAQRICPLKPSSLP